MTVSLDSKNWNGTLNTRTSVDPSREIGTNASPANVPKGRKFPE